jgi:hypothetical protein
MAVVVYLVIAVILLWPVTGKLIRLAQRARTPKDS